MKWERERLAGEVGTEQDADRKVKRRDEVVAPE